MAAEEQAIAALEQSERRFRKLFQYSQGLICTHDLQGVVLSVNPAAARALGYPAVRLLGQPFTDFMPPQHHARFAEYLLRIADQKEDAGAFRPLGANGRSVVWEYHNVLDEDERGEPYVLGHAQDITDRVLQARRLREETLHDPLTGCLNRQAPSLIEARLGDDDWSVGVVDLDRFKHVNDTEGHVRGDEALASMGSFLRDGTARRDGRALGRRRVCRGGGGRVGCARTGTNTT